MWNTIKTALVVSLVTAAVWLFAEAQSVRAVDAAITLEFRGSANGEVVMSLLERPEGRERVQVWASGPASSISALEGLAVGVVPVTPESEGVPSASGETRLDMVRVLRGLPELRARGLNVTRVEPATVRVWMDRVVARPVRVRVETGDAELDGPAQVRPDSITLRVPESRAGLIDADTAVVVRLDRAALQGAVPGRRETLAGRDVELPTALQGLPGVSASPAKVDLTFTIRARTATARLRSVPVYVNLPAVEVGRWDVVVQDQFIADVTVTGPADQVAQVESGALRVTATVPLTFEELERGIAQKEAVFTELPSALKFEAASRMVRLSITRRPESGGAAARPEAPGVE